MPKKKPQEPEPVIEIGEEIKIPIKKERQEAGPPSSKDLGTWYQGHRTAQ